MSVGFFPNINGSPSRRELKGGETGSAGPLFPPIVCSKANWPGILSVLALLQEHPERHGPIPLEP